MWKRRIVWMVLTLSALSFYLFENNAGTRVLLWTLVLLPALSALALYLPPARLSGALSLPVTLERGEQGRGTLLLEKSGAGLPLTLAGAVAVENRLTGERQETSFVCALGGGKKEALSFCLTSAHCGMLTVSLGEVRAMDFLGLFVRKLPLGLTENIPVPPRVWKVDVALAETAGQLAEHQVYSTQRPGWDPSETFRIREYAPGDPIRQIHWKLSEKIGKLLVRDYGLPLVRQMLLLLETVAPPGGGLTAGDMDVMLDLLFSVSHRLLEQGIAHTVGWYDQTAGEYASLEIGNESDREMLQTRLLENPIRADGLTAAVSCAVGQGGGAWSHIALISTYVPPDMDLLQQGSRVTVLLTGSGAAAAGCGAELSYFTGETLSGGEFHLEL